jgi:RNA polymerase sigma-70 factor, ECF subfamily
LEKEFLNLLARHQGILLKVCRMYCDSNTDAEDLYQEVVYRLWKGYPRFEGRSQPSTWMYRVALNTAITRLRQQTGRPAQRPITEQDDAIADAAEQRLDILFDVELQQAIGTLGPADKALLMLYLDERPYREIADILGITEGNAGVKINRIKNKLKQLIKP